MEIFILIIFELDFKIKMRMFIRFRTQKHWMYASHSTLTCTNRNNVTPADISAFEQIWTCGGTPCLKEYNIEKKNREKFIIFNLKNSSFIQITQPQKIFQLSCFYIHQASPRNLYPYILYCIDVRSFVHIFQISNYTWETNKGIIWKYV